MLLLANEWDGIPKMQFCTGRRLVGSSPEWVRPILPAAAGTVAVAGMIPGIDLAIGVGSAVTSEKSDV